MRFTFATLAVVSALHTFATALSDRKSANLLTAETLIAISPQTASCADATYQDECTDATRAAMAINKAFETYNITSTGEQVAIVAYILFESGDFHFNRNHYPPPGRPGQGTRMMAMPLWIKRYASAVAGAEAVAMAEAAGGDAGLNAVLALVNRDDERSFGSAAWFLASTCAPAIRASLAGGSLEGWHAFLTECVHTTVKAERDIMWTSAKHIMRAVTDTR